ncbi:MAG: hypothetical protein JNK87_40915 [Bryobacterales bacterium]|nr:hypothetical protein [Bryobacterales bacterium]
MPSSFDPNFGSALEAAQAIRDKVTSSAELTEHLFRRMDQYEPKLNSYVYQLREQAMEAARAADQALARGEAMGPLHGVPISVKESFAVEGKPCTWGIPPFQDIPAPADSTAVQRLREAGAVLLGATNVPFSLMDSQSFNDIYGRSNNPWDLDRTPGGSSGGSAASLAAGTSFFSIGSDIGGSIRGPASFCGVYGHKPTLDIVPMNGHLPGGQKSLPGFSTLLAVAGPMARSAEDLLAGLQILAGPEMPEAKAMRWTLPPARHTRLRDFRIGFILEDSEVPVDAETKAVLEAAVRAWERSGASVKEGWPDGMSFADLLDTYYFHLAAFDFAMMPPEAQAKVEPMADKGPRTWGRGVKSRFSEWQRMNMKRLSYRKRWEDYFRNFDVFLSPTMFTTAIRHDTTPVAERQVTLADGSRHSFWNLVTYICPATLTGCPATTAPAGLTKSGLPVGLQIMGPYLEDATPIEFARLLANEIGGFQAPAGYV